MNDHKEKKDENAPYCFGKIEDVFPMGEEGLRVTPESCFPCLYKTPCLRSAMRGLGGYSVKEEIIDRAYSSGRMGFMERWAKKKDLHRRKKIREEDAKEDKNEE